LSHVELLQSDIGFRLFSHVCNVRNSDDFLDTKELRKFAFLTSQNKSKPAIQCLGDFPGEVDLSWPGIRGTKSFIVQIASAFPIFGEI